MTPTTGTNNILTEIDQARSAMLELIVPLDENKINTVPYKDSWTAGQLFRHVSKSVDGMAKAMQMEATAAERDPGERIDDLKKNFLDFSKKMKSPDFIVPAPGPYQKETTIDELEKAFEQFKQSTDHANLSGLLEKLPLGPITKLELLHFVLFHTQRHLYQLNKICEALKNSPPSAVDSRQ
ncbi:MAG: DinB family protein [Ginsengibacter sp.]